MIAAQVAARLAAAWGPLEPIAPPPVPSLDILRAAPRGSRGWYSLATAGLSERPLAVPDELRGRVPARCELVTYSLDDASWPVALLAELAAVEGPLELLPYQPIALAQPLDGAPALRGVLLCPPYFESEELAALDTDAALIWAVPVTIDELELAVLAGGRALEALFFQADLRPAPDPHRPSVLA